jgi:hypothetical protein
MLRAPWPTLRKCHAHRPAQLPSLSSDAIRSARSVWLELKSDNVEEMTRKMLAFGVRKLEVPDPHFYFQAPGGQCLRLVGIDEDCPFMRGPEKARTSRRLKKHSGGNNRNECHPGRSHAPLEGALTASWANPISTSNLWPSMSISGWSSVVPMRRPYAISTINLRSGKTLDQLG